MSEPNPDDPGSPGRAREVRLEDSTLRTSGSLFEPKARRAMNMSRGETLQVFLALLLAVGAFAGTQHWWIAGFSALGTVALAFAWPKLEPHIARLVHWMSDH